MTKPYWTVCKWSKGVQVLHCDEGMPGGDWWHFKTLPEATEAAALIRSGAYTEPPDESWADLGVPYLKDFK